MWTPGPASRSLMYSKCSGGSEVRQFTDWGRGEGREGRGEGGEEGGEGRGGGREGGGRGGGREGGGREGDQSGKSITRLTGL